jgi:hypothetical protein
MDEQINQTKPNQIKSNQIKMHILYSIYFFLLKVCFLWDNGEKYGTARHATDGNILQHRKDMIYILHNQDKNTVTIIGVNSSVKYFVAWQQCKNNPLLHFHGNTEHLCIVDSYIYGNNNKKGIYCSVPMATTDTINNMPWCNVTHCMYIAYLVGFTYCNSAFL